jgi:hypothetical protein
MSVTDGTTTVDPTTSLRLPAGTLTDLGGGVAGVGLMTYLVGPFTLHHSDVGLSDGVLLVPLASGTLVLAVGVFITEAWDGDATYVRVAIGGHLYAAPDDDWGFITPAATPLSPLAGTGWKVARGLQINDYSNVAWDVWGSALAFVTEAGGLLGVSDASTSTTGEADIYAVIATPAA